MLSLDALADPTRRRIIEMLAVQERSAGEIGEQFEMSAPAISQHLRVLREAGLVTVRREAQRRHYTLNPDGLDELEAWLTRTRAFWSQRLDALESALRDDDLARAKSSNPKPDET